MNEYQEQILDHYKNPRNYGKPSWTPTHVHTVANESCGDSVTFYLLVQNGIISDVSFKAEGCSIAIGAASLLTEELHGRSVEHALSLTYDDFQVVLGLELTPSRVKCASLGLHAVQEALGAQMSHVYPSE